MSSNKNPSLKISRRGCRHFRRSWTDSPLEADLKQKTEESAKIQVEKDNLEMSNMAMLGDLDDLQKKYDDADQKKSELLVSTAELEKFVDEMREEIQQLKQEVFESNKAKEESEVENQQLKVDLEDAIMAKEEVELAVEAGGQRGHGCRCCEEQGPCCRRDQDTGRFISVVLQLNSLQ